VCCSTVAFKLTRSVAKRLVSDWLSSGRLAVLMVGEIRIINRGQTVTQLKKQLMCDHFSVELQLHCGGGQRAYINPLHNLLSTTRSKNADSRRLRRGEETVAQQFVCSLGLIQDLTYLVWSSISNI
jgi:hypothetical protein